MKKKLWLLCCLFSIALLADAKLYVATQNLPVRKNKKSHSEVLGFISNGATIDVADISGGWAKVKYKDQYGYIKTGHLKMAPTPGVTQPQPEETSSSWFDANKSLWWIAGGIALIVAARMLFSYKKNYIRKTSKSKKNAPKNHFATAAYWFQCQHCGAVVKNDTHPSKHGCLKSQFHHWVQLSEVGTEKYMCKRCITTIQAATFPATTGCPGGDFHDWNRI